MSLLGYRKDIDGIRAVAVLSVLVFHFGLLPGGKAGFMGVDVFFVISGFLITAIIKGQLEDGSFRLGAFYANRVRRLAPALFATLAMTFAAGALWLFPSDLLELGRQVVSSQFYVANIYYWRNVSYFGLGADSVYLLHTWSLAVEEQFYLIYPVALLLMHRYCRAYFWWLIGGGFVASFALNLAFVAAKPEATFYLLPTRAWELLAGALTFLAASRLAITRQQAQALGALGIACIALSFLLFDQTVRFPGYFALLPTLGAAALILAGSAKASIATQVLSTAPVVYVGKISYSLYLVHWPINVFAVKVLAEGYSTTWRVGLFLGCFALAALLYHLVENPYRRRRVAAANNRLMYGYATGLALTVALVVAVQAGGGWRWRFPEYALRIADRVHDKTPDIPCHYGAGPLRQDNLCRLGDPSRTARWLVFGDSHAWAAHAAFDRWLLRRGEAGLLVYRSACLPLAGVHNLLDQGNCQAFNEAVADFLSANPQIDQVLLVSTWRQAIEGAISPTQDRKLSLDESLAFFDAQFSATVSRLSGLGARVYVWEPVPGARRSVPEALARNAIGQGRPDLEFRREEYFSTYAFFFGALERNRKRLAGSFSPASAVCQTGRCLAAIGDQPLYFDNGHVTRSSADFWAGMLDRQYGQRPPVAGPR